jgi:hypothetical protein
MKSPAARTFSLIIGGLAVLVGATWIGQGAGFIKGSFMTAAGPGSLSDCSAWLWDCS